MHEVQKESKLAVVEKLKNSNVVTMLFVDF